MHGVVIPGGTSRACHADTTESFGKPVPGSLSTIIRSYKSAVTKRINELRSIQENMCGREIFMNM